MRGITRDLRSESMGMRIPPLCDELHVPVRRCAKGEQIPSWAEKKEMAGGKRTERGDEDPSDRRAGWNDRESRYLTREFGGQPTQACRRTPRRNHRSYALYLPSCWFAWRWMDMRRPSF